MNTTADIENKIRLIDHYLNRNVDLAEAAVLNKNYDPVSALVIAKKARELYQDLKQVINTKT